MFSLSPASRWAMVAAVALAAGVAAAEPDVAVPGWNLLLERSVVTVFGWDRGLAVLPHIFFFSNTQYDVLVSGTSQSGDIVRVETAPGEIDAGSEQRYELLPFSNPEDNDAFGAGLNFYADSVIDEYLVVGDPHFGPVVAQQPTGDEVHEGQVWLGPIIGSDLSSSLERLVLPTHAASGCGHDVLNFDVDADGLRDLYVLCTGRPFATSDSTVPRGHVMIALMQGNGVIDDPTVREVRQDNVSLARLYPNAGGLAYIEGQLAVMRGGERIAFRTVGVAEAGEAQVVVVVLNRQGGVDRFFELAMPQYNGEPRKKFGTSLAALGSVDEEYPDADCLASAWWSQDTKRVFTVVCFTDSGTIVSLRDMLVADQIGGAATTDGASWGTRLVVPAQTEDEVENPPFWGESLSRAQGPIYLMATETFLDEDSGSKKTAVWAVKFGPGMDAGWVLLIVGLVLVGVCLLGGGLFFFLHQAGHVSSPSSGKSSTTTTTVVVAPKEEKVMEEVPSTPATYAPEHPPPPVMTTGEQPMPEEQQFAAAGHSDVLPPSMAGDALPPSMRTAAAADDDDDDDVSEVLGDA